MALRYLERTASNTVKHYARVLKVGLMKLKIDCKELKRAAKYGKIKPEFNFFFGLKVYTHIYTHTHLYPYVCTYIYLFTYVLIYAYIYL